jgi:hypothetical protein
MKRLAVVVVGAVGFGVLTVLKDLPPTLAGRVAVGTCGGVWLALMFILLQKTKPNPR